MAISQIEWTDATWNPVVGCSMVSAGCTHCYAMVMAKRLEAMHVEKYKGLTKKSGDRVVWNGVVRIDKNILNTPYTWKKPKKIFVNSMSDLFHDSVDDDFIIQVWNVMRETPQHNYQVLTKRPERMESLINSLGMEPLPNVWVGTTIEDRDAVNRVNYLRRTRAAVHFISFEPLIGDVGDINLKGIDWAIVGGESGKFARPIKESWIDGIHKQCIKNGTAFFFKQWGTWGKDNKRRSKKANGRIYRGKIWDEMPITQNY